MSAIFPDFWHPLPNIHRFFSTICQQFWPIFDTSPPTNDRRDLWMAPCWLTGRFCSKFNKQIFICCCTSLKTAINAIRMAWNTTFLVGSSCSLHLTGQSSIPLYKLPLVFYRWTQKSSRHARESKFFQVLLAWFGPKLKIYKLILNKTLYLRIKICMQWMPNLAYILQKWVSDVCLMPISSNTLGIDIMYLVLADRNMQVRFGLKVVWESWLGGIWLIILWFG